MAKRVFIDGEAGTTGLEIRERLEGRRDIALVRLDPARRKDASARKDALDGADAAILCLPDEAAREAVALVENPSVTLVDASTAHRTDAAWAYGFAEMDRAQPGRIAASRRIANPGCYPTGMIALVRPLVSAGILPADFPVTVNAVSGYSGGGKQLIARYEDATAADRTDSPFWAYGLGLEHKHVPEMQTHGLLTHRPLFVPSVGRFYRGMIVQVPLQLAALPGAPTPARIHACLADHFASCRHVTVAPLAESAGLAALHAEGMNNTDDMRLHVFGNARHGQAVLAAVLDNLGKGAAGAAVQNLDLALGTDAAATRAA